MNCWDSLRAITRRALNITYISPNVCELASGIPASGSGASTAAVLDFLPVFRAAGPVLTVAPFSAGNLRLSWSAVDGGFVYVLYRSTSENGTFTVVATGVQALFFVDTPPAPGVWFYRVTSIEKDFGETFPSNVVSATV